MTLSFWKACDDLHMEKEKKIKHLLLVDLSFCSHFWECYAFSFLTFQKLCCASFNRTEAIFSFSLWIHFVFFLLLYSILIWLHTFPFTSYVKEKRICRRRHRKRKRNRMNWEDSRDMSTKFWLICLKNGKNALSSSVSSSSLLHIIFYLIVKME